MKHYSMYILSALALAILPLYESGAADLKTIGPESTANSTHSTGSTYLEIAPRFTYGLQYEDNIDGEYDGKDRLSDWSNHYKPEFDITAFSPRFSLSSHAGFDIAEYINERDFNYVDQDYTLNLGYIPNSRLEFSLGAGYSVNSDNYRSEDIENIDPDQYVRDKDKTTEFTGGFSYVLTPRSSIGLTGNFSEYDTSSTDGSGFYSIIGGYTYSLSPRTNLVFNTAFFYYDFDGNNRGLDPADPFYYDYSNYSFELKNYAITGGFEHMFENDGKLLAQFGMRYSETDSTERTDTGSIKTSGNGNGWIALLEYQKRFNDFLFGFEASQDISVSPYGASYESTNLVVRTQYRITQRLDAILDCRYVRAYASSSDDEFTGGSRDDDTYIVSPSLNYKAYRWLNTSIGYQFRGTQFNESDRSSHSNLFYIDFKFIPLRNWVLR